MRPLTRLVPLALFLGLVAPAAAQQDTPRVWFPKPELDLGTHLEGELAKGRWDFRNPHDAPHQFKAFQPSCTCSKATVHIGDLTYSIENQPKPNTIYRTREVDGKAEREIVEGVEIGPGQDGYIDFQVDLRGVNGKKEASVVVHTDDDENRVLTLRATATASQFFVVMPPEINLNKMSWKDSRQFTARITSPIRPDFEILGIDDPVPDQMKVDYRKEVHNGVATWIVEGTYGPNVDPRAGGGILNFRTDVEGRRVPLRVMAWIEGPLTIEPSGFVAFGRIKAGDGASRVVEFRANDDF
ncbi:MAG: hypothetical protein KDA28_15345, partial [Phycisphaerales bacterium]|nr:hypothetical protein [Phycisphaerales bacterium]